MLISPSWIFRHPRFVDWLQNPGSTSDNTLWLSATAGFGKSVLAAYLTKALKDKFPTSPVTYFFCKEKSDLSEGHQIVLTILKQLSAYSSGVSAHVQQIWEQDDSIADLTADYGDFYENLLLPVIDLFHSTSSERIFVIIDGVNELPQSRM